MILNFFDHKEVLGEITVVIDGIQNDKFLEFDKFELRKELSDLIDAGISLSQASKYLAKKKNLPKRVVYNINKNLHLIMDEILKRSYYF